MSVACGAQLVGKTGRSCVAEGPMGEVSVAGVESSALQGVRLASREAIHTAPGLNHGDLLRILRPQARDAPLARGARRSQKSLFEL